ncbi:amino acid ABC transporter permease [Clostridium algidicarnis]|uniref:amino acid ABC transporter permease n=1 Tax=Clostridium algidicarnis TaxID=37659 RepID=UPI001C0D50B8|nr:amino acid ABC transporter permease [Clostridium algidicarnis]MBU3194079.1 amino acid ABC transporter permease [Clostridium algidicarnis]
MKFKDLFVKKDKDISLLQKAVNIAIVIILLMAIVFISFKKLGYPFNFSKIIKYRYKFYTGFMMTIVISFFSLILSLVIGTIIASLRNSKILVLNYFSRIYVEIIRGTPLLVQIFIFFYIVAAAAKLENRYIMGTIILSMFSAAYVSEIIRSGVESIEKSQLETAMSLGFTSYQKYRYIILPQVVKTILPPLAGQFVSLVKDSSLLSVIAVSELTKNVQEVDAINFATMENYMALAILYLVLTLPISQLSRRLERKFNYEN